MKEKGTAKRTAARLTPQRAEILRALAGNRSHPSAEDIHRRIARKFPGLSLATVYNNLQAMLSQGELAEIRIDPERRRFDPGVHPHDHFRCERCGLIVDFRTSCAPAAPKGLPKGFKVKSGTVNFSGLCPGCARKGRAAGRGGKGK